MNQNKSKVKAPTAAKVFYVLSAVLFVTAIYMLVTTIMYIDMYLESYAMNFNDMWSNMVQYLINGAVPYFVYALLMFGIGRIICMLDKCCSKSAQSEDCGQNEASDGADERIGGVAEDIKEAEESGEAEALEADETAEESGKEEAAGECEESDAVVESEDAVEETTVVESGKSEEDEAACDTEENTDEDDEKQA